MKPTKIFILASLLSLLSQIPIPPILTGCLTSSAILDGINHGWFGSVPLFICALLSAVLWRRERRESKWRKALAMAAMCFLTCLPLAAQQATNTVPTSPQTFVTSVEQYFTSHDPTKTAFVTDRLFAWTGAEYVNGATTANVVGIDYDLWKSSSLTTAASNYSITLPTTNSPTVSGYTIGLGVVVRNEGVAGTVMSGEGGVEVGLVSGTDTKIIGLISGGDELVTHKAYLSFEARVEKALSTHTYGLVGIGLRTSAPAVPSVRLGLGASF